MADARERAEWDRASELWILTAEINRNEKKRSKPFGLADIHPYHATGVEEQEPAQSWAAAAKFFGDDGDGKQH